MIRSPKMDGHPGNSLTGVGRGFAFRNVHCITEHAASYTSPGLCPGLTVREAGRGYNRAEIYVLCALCSVRIRRLWYFVPLYHCLVVGVEMLCLCLCGACYPPIRFSGSTCPPPTTLLRIPMQKAWRPCVFRIYDHPTHCIKWGAKA